MQTIKEPSFEEKVEYLAQGWAITEQMQTTAQIVSETLESNEYMEADADFLRIKNEINKDYASVEAFNLKFDVV